MYAHACTRLCWVGDSIFMLLRKWFAQAVLRSPLGLPWPLNEVLAFSRYENTICIVTDAFITSVSSSSRVRAVWTSFQSIGAFCLTPNLFMRLEPGACMPPPCLLLRQHLAASERTSWLFHSSYWRGKWMIFRALIEILSCFLPEYRPSLCLLEAACSPSH